ncbi:hypothetical protein [uncultured Shewanella sp.]|uniref:hypothetical protein n=1 Tax=uncultured Shewanella sp. TaxID=173975 RepID=UPI00260B4C8A|nr:hypothetical protein [uncultured Shewanella sp.]
MRLLPLLLLISSCAHSGEVKLDVDSILNKEHYSSVFKQAFINIYDQKPNFNTEDYLFTYSCGGGAVCGSVFDPSFNDFISLPDDFIGASDVQAFKVEFNALSNKVCIWGQSAYNAELYNGKCFIYKDKNFKESNIPSK